MLARLMATINDGLVNDWSWSEYREGKEGLLLEAMARRCSKPQMRPCPGVLGHNEDRMGFGDDILFLQQASWLSRFDVLNLVL